MSPDSGYQIPEQTFERTRADLYAYYRKQLDEEAVRKAQERRIIDVAATRVSLEEETAQTQRDRARDAFAEVSDQVTDQRANQRAAESRTQQERTRRAKETTGENEFAYEPRRAATGEVDLKQGPGVRGMFIDLEA